MPFFLEACRRRSGFGDWVRAAMALWPRGPCRSSARKVRRAMIQLRQVADSAFVLLPAYWTVAQARSYLEGLDYTHVIVRRTDDPQPGSPTYHYLYTKAEA